MYGWLVQRPLIGRILGPRLNLAALDDQSDKKVGPTLDAHIKENLVRAREDVDRANAPEYELDSGRPRDDFIVLVGGDTGLKSALDKASEATEKTKLIAAIVNVIYAVLPIRRVDVAGVVDLPGGDAASATLNLSRNGTLAASASVNAPAVPAGTELGVPDFLKLADPAAVWVQYEVLRALKGGGDPLPAHGAESYVYVRQGLERQFAGDQRRADELYETAVKLAPDNWAARLNQAMTEARQAGNLPAAVAMLARAFDGIKQA
jgi:tetratricopeptide (TPR) repeat protein